MLTEKKQKDVLNFINVGKATGSLKLEDSDMSSIKERLSENGEGSENGNLPSAKLYSYAETMGLLSISKTVLYSLIREKRLNPVYLTPKTPRIKESEISALSN